MRATLARTPACRPRLGRLGTGSRSSPQCQAALQQAAPAHRNPAVQASATTTTAASIVELKVEQLRHSADAALRRLAADGAPSGASLRDSWPEEAEASAPADGRGRAQRAAGRRNRSAQRQAAQAGGSRGTEAAGSRSRSSSTSTHSTATPSVSSTSSKSSSGGMASAPDLGAPRYSSVSEGCHYCRYPCRTSGLPECQAGEYLKMWAADSYLKPAFFDSTWTGQPPNTSGMAVVSKGGRCAGRWKPQNQDSFLLHAFQASTTMAPAIVVGVFDGHGVLGAAVARQVRESMLGALGSYALPASILPASGAPARSPAGAAARRAARGGSLRFGGAGGDGPVSTVSQEAAERCLLQAFACAEQRMGEDGRDFSKSGSTAALCMLLRDRIVAAWAGDSRAVVGVRGQAGEGYVAHELTHDHKPDSPTELARIAAAGGRVDRLATDSQGNPMGPFRIFLPGQWAPGLAVARAFGDTMASDIGVTSTPEFAVFQLPAAPLVASYGEASTTGGRSGAGNGARGLFGRAPPPSQLLILATDGLWEWVSSQRAVQIAGACPTADDAAHALAEEAQKEWALKYRGRNCDDITVVVAFM